MGGTIGSGGVFTESGVGGTVQLNGTVTSVSSNITFANAITLTGASSISSGTGAGDILFSITVDGNNNLSLGAGAGAISFGGAVGGGTRIGVLAINSGAVSTTQGISAASISQLSGSGTFGALNTNQAAGIHLQGTTFTLAGNVTTTGAGPLTIQTTGALVLSGTSFSIAGAVDQIGLGTTTLSSAITAGGVIPSTSTGIQFAGPITASGGSLSTAASGKDINLLSAVDGSSVGVGNLTLDAGALGNISVSGNIGSTTRMGALVFVNAHDIAAQNMTAASIVQSAGAGTTTITGNLNTSALGGMSLTGKNFTINGSLISSNGGPFAISHTGLLILNAGNSTLLTGPFIESGIGGTATLSGLIHASNANVSFANPITLAGNTIIDSDGGGDILISSTVDGPFDITYIAGTGNITLAAAVGGTTPVNSLTITSATDVTAHAISAGKIVQSDGAGLTLFNGALSTTLSNGISLNGFQFTFQAPVTTLSGGIVSITNSGLLTMPAAAPFNLDGAFSQLGGGPVSLCTTVTTTGEAVSFTGPVTLCGNAKVDTDSLFGGISFAGVIDGSNNLELTAGQGNITLPASVGGGTPLNLLKVDSCVNLTAGAIRAVTIDIEGVSGLATFAGPMTTTGASGITLNGAAFTLDGNVTTSGGGPLTITNSGTLTVASSATLLIDGSFTQTGIGAIDIGGSLTTNGHPITFAGPIVLTGDLALASGNGSITFGSDVEGPHSVTITAGTGDVLVPAAISIISPLTDFTVVSSHDISLNGIGTDTVMLSGALSLTAGNIISLMNTTYSAHSQYYSSGTDLDFINPGVVTLITSGGPITFAGAPADLNSGTDLAVNTNGGEFSFNSIHGTNFENLTINTGTGLASLGALPNVGNINTVTVDAGQILINAPMNMVNTNFTSLGAIANAGAPVDIASTNSASFNALNGDVGTLASPILVHTSNQIFAGAGGRPDSLAVFNGSSVDNTVHPIPSNPPCEIIFNGVIIKNCQVPPVPPGPAPSPARKKVFSFPFAVPGFDSSYFNLASDYFFFTYFLDDSYLRESAPMYYRAGGKTSWNFFKRWSNHFQDIQMSEPEFEWEANPDLQVSCVIGL